MSKQTTSSKISAQNKQQNDCDLGHFRREKFRQSQIKFYLSLILILCTTTFSFGSLALFYSGNLSESQTVSGVTLMLKIFSQSVRLMENSQKSPEEKK